MNFTYLLLLLFAILAVTACSPESVYLGGIGGFKEYESMSEYNSRTDRRRQTRQGGYRAASGFSDSVVDDPFDGERSIRAGPHRHSQEGRYVEYDEQDGGTPVVSGTNRFKAKPSLLKGMKDSPAIQRATMKPYKVAGKVYYPRKARVGDKFYGTASWYGPDFHSKATSNGEMYDMHAHTAASKTLPINTVVKVTNKENSRVTYVRINDRGPFVEGRIIDLSNVAARDIDMVGKGTASVMIEVVGFAGNSNVSGSGKTTGTSANGVPNKHGTGGGTTSRNDEVGFVIMLSSFKKRESAEFDRQQKMDLLKNSQKYSVSIIEEGDLYRVAITGFRSKREAADFKSKNNIDGSIVTK